MIGALRSLKREPFGLCAFVTFCTLVWRNGGSAELWTLPIVLAVSVMAVLADELWQDRLDAQGNNISREPTAR